MHFLVKRDIIMGVKLESQQYEEIENICLPDPSLLIPFEES